MLSVRLFGSIGGLIGGLIGGNCLVKRWTAETLVSIAVILIAAGIHFLVYAMGIPLPILVS